MVDNYLPVCRILFCSELVKAASELDFVCSEQAVAFPSRDDMDDVEWLCIEVCNT